MTGLALLGLFAEDVATLFATAIGVIVAIALIKLASNVAGKLTVAALAALARRIGL